MPRLLIATKNAHTTANPFRAEFVSLEITRPEKKLSLLAGAESVQSAKFSDRCM